MIESVKNKKKRISEIIQLLKKEYPDSKCSLEFENPFQLIVSTILSAQCTDKRVNLVTPFLFREYKNFNQLSKANLDDVFTLIKSINSLA